MPRTPAVRVGRDHVDVARRRVVLADERDEEPDEPAVRRLAIHDVPVKCWNHSRGSSARIRRPPHHSSTSADDPGVVGLGRAAEGQVIVGSVVGSACRHQATTAATSELERHEDAEGLAEVVDERRTPPSGRANSHRPTWPRTTAATARPTASRRRRADRVARARERQAVRDGPADRRGDDEQPGRDRQERRPGR